ncbi:HAUS augmin-like complex subunit 6 [Mastacembelus armatus]|uniref:HAUS augmin-like complex, subunit 6 n=1 Tax=Mastacembelus armatus TaxID=205130 RepID=A0A3Q3RSW5_9TELE|nr:HAUS augmin-like complex subunit 6 [Mastacembelus armatus]
MANPALMQKQNGKHLWFALLGLGFQQDAALSSNVVINVKHANLGPNMFDKPNKGAFYIVTRFLLEKLNPTRFHEAFRNCWPVLNHKLDAEFRKVTCSWLREIMDEAAGAGSKVVASLFLSPGGPKFISLMVDLANHVILQEMKTFTTDGSWVPEAAAMPASSLDMEMKRLNLISARFLKAAVYQDRFYHEYQRRAQLLVKSMRDNRAEGAKYDEPLKFHSDDSAQMEASLPEKIKKVRSFWSAIDEMLLAIKENQNAVGSVLKGHVDQYVLDGTDRVLKIPQSLLERIEQLPHQLSSGSLYEAGQLNILCVLELMNHALQLLRDERCRVPDAPKAQLSPQDLQDKCQQMSRVLQDLHLLRQKISKEEIPEVRSSIRQLETEWDRKWMDVLKDTPLVSFLNEDPALGFLSPMAPLSFEPVAEASYTNSVFSQYPAKLLEEKLVEGESQYSINPVCSTLKSSCPAVAEKTENPAASDQTSRANTSLDWLFDTPPPLTTVPAPPQVSVRKTTHVPPKVAPMRLNTRILDMECDNLADQFADAVATASPTEGRVKGLDLEGLLSTLHGDPFSARKQLPRTPESLIMDVKSSWRKALEENKAEKIQHSPNLTNSIMHHLSPLGPSASSQTISGSIIPTATSHSDPPVYKQDVSLKSSLLWDTFNTELPDSPSGTGSSAMHFTLDHETLPEMPSCDSLLSLDDESVNMKSEQEDELLLPPLTAEAKKSPLTTRRQLQQAFDGGSFMDNRKTMPVCLLSGHVVSGLDKDWLMEPAASVDASDKVFSLDLEKLETHSPPQKQEYSFPKLITFSPIDDMKC